MNQIEQRLFYFAYFTLHILTIFTVWFYLLAHALPIYALPLNKGSSSDLTVRLYPSDQINCKHGKRHPIIDPIYDTTYSGFRLEANAFHLSRALSNGGYLVLGKYEHA